MKMTTLKSVAIAVGLASSAFGQATSPVVGYETLPLAANQFNLVGQRLHGKVLSTGTLTGAAGSVLSDSAADFSALTATTYVVEITSGAAEGFLSLASVAGNDVTATADFSTSGVAIGDGYSIREASSVQGLFGDPATSLVSTGSESTSDVVWVPNGSGGYTKYFFQTPLFGAPRWFNSTGGAIVTAPISISPTSGFFVEKRATPSDLVVSGSVKTDSSVFLESLSGFTPLSSVFPVGVTLQNSGLQSVLTSAGGEAASDVVWLPSGTGYTKYFFQTPLFGSPRWFNSTAGAIADADIPMTAGFFIESKSPTTNFLQFTSDPAIYAGL